MSNTYNFTQDSTLQTLTSVSTFSSIYRTFDRPNIKFFDNAGIYNPSNNNINIFTNNTDAIMINQNQNITFRNSLNVIGNISTSGLSVFDMNTTSTTIFNNLNSFSNSAQLSINNLNTTSTTIFNNLNSFSNSAQLVSII